MSKAIQLLICIILFSVNYYSQDIQLEKELGYKGKIDPVYTKIRNKGILVSYYKYEKRGRKIKVCLKFYDKNLKEKWDIQDVNVFSFEDKDYVSQVGKVNNGDAPGVVSSDGSYLFIYGGNKIKKIAIETAKIEEVELDRDKHLLKAVFETYIEDSNFYMVFNDRYTSKVNPKVSGGAVEIIKININTLEQEYFTFELPSLGIETVETPRGWFPLGIRNSNLYFLDNYVVRDNSINKKGRRFLCVNLKGNIIIDKAIILGDDIRNSRRTGNFVFNKFNDGKLYVFSMPQIEGQSVMNYQCFDEGLNLIWSKEYTFENKAISTYNSNEFSVEKIKNKIYLYNKYDDKNYSLSYDLLDETLHYSIFDDDNQHCISSSDYDFSCPVFEVLSQYPKIESFLRKDIAENKNKIKINHFFFDDRVILTKTDNQLFRISSKTISVSIYMFKI